MPTTPVSIDLNAEQQHKLDQIAAELRCTPAEAVGKLIDASRLCSTIWGDELRLRLAISTAPSARSPCPRPSAAST